MDAKEFHAAARRIEGLQRKLCETEVERDAWKRSYQDLSKSAQRRGHNKVEPAATDAGVKLLGWRTVCAVELDSYARRVLLARQADGWLGADYRAQGR